MLRHCQGKHQVWLLTVKGSINLTPHYPGRYGVWLPTAKDSTTESSTSNVKEHKFDPLQSRTALSLICSHSCTSATWVSCTSATWVSCTSATWVSCTSADQSWVSSPWPWCPAPASACCWSDPGEPPAIRQLGNGLDCFFDSSVRLCFVRSFTLCPGFLTYCTCVAVLSTASNLPRYTHI